MAAIGGLSYERDGQTLQLSCKTKFMLPKLGHINNKLTFSRQLIKWI